ncbi:hypothetical protein D9M72_642070 [compost metagenome]
MHAGPNHVVAQNGRILLVGCDSRDDVGTFNGFLRSGVDRNRKAIVAQIACATFTCRAINIKQTQIFDPQNSFERQRLKLALCAIANNRHGL